MRNYWVLFCVFMLCGSLAAQENDALFTEGITAFENKDYQSSIEVFSQLIETDSLNPTLHYNLGTSYLRLENIGLSIYHLEKALKLRPDYEQARINLNFAEKLKSTISKGSLPIPQEQVFYSLFNFLKPNSWAYLALVTMLVGTALFVFYIFNSKATTKKVLFTFGLLAAGVSIMSYFISKNQSNFLLKQHYVIVIKEEITLMQEPRTVSKVLLEISEGSKGLILEETKQWIKIRLENDNIGWVEKNKVLKY